MRFLLTLLALLTGLAGADRAVAAPAMPAAWASIPDRISCIWTAVQSVTGAPEDPVNFPPRPSVWAAFPGSPFFFSEGPRVCADPGKITLLAVAAGL